MQLEPALLKQLLDLQIMRNLQVSASGSDSLSTDSDSDSGLNFTELLQQMMSETGEGTTSGGKRIIPAEQLLAESRLAEASFGWNQAGLSTQALSLGTGAGADSGSAAMYEGLIQQASSRHQVDSNLVKAVIQAESSFNSRAVSQVGAKGLMQLMDSTAAGFGITNSFDPAQNIEGGTQFLSNLLNKYHGNEGVALAAYNAGPARVDRLGIRTDADLMAKLHLLPKETQNYVTKVLGYKNQFASVG